MTEQADAVTIRSRYTGYHSQSEGSPLTTSVRAFGGVAVHIFKKGQRFAPGTGSPASVLPGYLYLIGGGLPQLSTECDLRLTTLDVDYSPAHAKRGLIDKQGTLEISDENRAAAIALIDEWLADTSGYDEATWPALKKGIEESRTSERKRFSE